MKIEHIALYVKDLETARNFFVKYLNRNYNLTSIHTERCKDNT